MPLMGTLREVKYTHFKSPSATKLHTFEKKVSAGEYILHTAVSYPIALDYGVECYVAINSDSFGDYDTSAIHYEAGYGCMRYAYNLRRPVRFTGPATILMGVRTPEASGAFFCYGLEVVS